MRIFSLHYKHPFLGRRVFFMCKAATPEMRVAIRSNRDRLPIPANSDSLRDRLVSIETRVTTEDGVKINVGVGYYDLYTANIEIDEDQLRALPRSSVHTFLLLPSPDRLRLTDTGILDDRQVTDHDVVYPVIGRLLFEVTEICRSDDLTVAHQKPLVTNKVKPKKSRLMNEPFVRREPFFISRDCQKPE